jgi:homoserine dehydrogenase
MNAVVVQGDAVGTTLYYGKGAGSEPTASAVVADLVDITRLHTADPDHRVPHLAFQPDAAGRHADPADRRGGHRLLPAPAVWPTRPACWRASPPSWPSTTSHRRGAAARSAEGENQTDLIILTHDTVEGRMKKALAQMQALPTVLAPIVRIRKEELASTSAPAATRPSATSATSCSKAWRPTAACTCPRTTRRSTTPR